MPVWDVLELGRKLVISGFIFLIPQQYSVLRLIIALLVSVGTEVEVRAEDNFWDPTVVIGERTERAQPPRGEICVQP